MKQLSQVWDLDSLFPNGAESEEYVQYSQKIKADITALAAKIKTLTAPQSVGDSQELAEVVNALQNIGIRMRQAGAFAGCLTAQNMKDKKAVQLSGNNKTLSAQYASLLTQFEQILLQVDDQTWQELLKDERFTPIAFNLDEKRSSAKDKMSPEQEALVNDLAIDGYHGWNDLYNTTISRISIPFEENGEVKQLSVGQAHNKLSDADKNVRDSMFQKWEQAWSEAADFCAESLNHLAGFRLNLYKHRGWDELHKEPLDFNRMSAQTLNVMWDTIDKNKGIFLEYFERKAKLLGVEKLSWTDVDAPIGNVSSKISYDEAAQFVVDQFEKFSPKMAEFTKMAFEKSWVEAEDRPGKRPGAFCTSLPDSKETRVFMTFSGTPSNVSTLAHELGHAYHQHVMNDMQPFAQQYAMNVAETASTFAELIVADASVKAATNPEERLSLLEDKVQRSIAFYMNIHARFIFETNFYAERKNGLVSVDRLNELMVAAQKEAYKDSLSEYHPHFWASKMHFYMTRVPFYNFPYTFGYLFSAGIYAKALAEGQGFEDKYIALLQDTASMPVEELAAKHLGVDITQPDFWQSAIDLSIADVKEFLELTK